MDNNNNNKDIYSQSPNDRTEPNPTLYSAPLLLCGYAHPKTTQRMQEPSYIVIYYIRVEGNMIMTIIMVLKKLSMGTFLYSKWRKILFLAVTPHPVCHFPFIPPSSSPQLRSLTFIYHRHMQTTPTATTTPIASLDQPRNNLTISVCVTRKIKDHRYK